MRQPVVPRTRTKYSDRSFAVQGPRVWNSLPTELRTPDISQTAFRNSASDSVVFRRHCALYKFTYLLTNWKHLFDTRNYYTAHLRHHFLVALQLANLRYVNTFNNNNKKGLLTQTVARDSAPWWIVIQYRQLAENGAFFIPLSYLAPPLPIFPLEFHGEVMRQETRVMGLLCGEGCVILTVTVFDWSTHVTDSGMDGQTDGRWHIARYSIYAVTR